MEIHPISPRSLWRSQWINRKLTYTLIKREIESKYKGSALGVFWSVLHPIVLLAAYTFVFSVIFKAKWNTGSESKVEFALVLFAGLLTYNFFADCLGRASTLIISNSNYVKKVVFPLEILPVVVLGSSFFQFLVGASVWILAYVLFIGVPPATLPLLFFLFIPLVFLIFGLMFLLSALGVYLRDTTQFVSIWLSFLMFLSPIFYPLSVVPDGYKAMIMLNPMTFMIEAVRDLAYWGRLPNGFSMIAFLAVSISILWLGYMVFQRTRKGFSDVL